MLWNKARRSENVNDQRKDKDVRSPTGIALAAGLIVSIMAGMGAYWADLEKSGDIETVNTMQEQTLGEMGKFVEDDPHRFFVESVLGSTEDVWTQIFAQVGKGISRLNLFCMTSRPSLPVAPIDQKKPARSTANWTRKSTSTSNRWSLLLFRTQWWRTLHKPM